MIIQEVLTQLQTSDHPVAKALHKMEHGKVLVLAFKAGMQLKDHRTPFSSLLLVLDGKVEYHEGEVVTSLSKYDEMLIAPEAVHAVTCLEDATCLLIQG
jgi:quercetin dioxygenase-like cupin family protein